MMNAPSPAAVRELTPQGHLRVAINLGNPVLAQKNPETGAPQGVSVELAHELAHRLGVDAKISEFIGAGQVVEALATSPWDIAFLAIDPLRAEQISFTAPYVIIEGTYVVSEDSPLHSIEDFDRDGVRISVGRGAAYDLFLSRTLEHAELVRSETSEEALENFVRDGLEAAAGVRQPLESFARSHPGLRVVDGRFTAIEQAMGTPAGRPEAAAYLAGFIEEMKASGFVAAALERTGQHDAAVAPPAAG